MTTESASVIALRKHAEARTRVKKAQVVASLHDHIVNRAPINVSAIARAAGVSREFLYEHAELVAAVKKAQAQQPLTDTPSGHTSPRESSLLAERATLMRKIQTQATQLNEADVEIQDLRAQRERWLGAQLDQLMQPARLSELVSENEQLTMRVLELTRRCEGLDRAATTLTEELRISRIAHAETLSQMDAEQAGGARMLRVLREE